MQLKTHQRPAKSLVREGLDRSRQAVLKAADKGEPLEQVLRLLGKVLTSPKERLHPLQPVSVCRVPCLFADHVPLTTPTRLNFDVIVPLWGRRGPP